MSDVEFEVPALAEYVSLVRMVVSSLAASRREIDDELLDDLRVAVSEACTLAVGDDPERRLTVTCREEPGSFVVDVAPLEVAPAGGGGIDPFSIDPLSLLGALVDGVETVTVGDTAILRLRVACAAVDA